MRNKFLNFGKRLLDFSNYSLNKSLISVSLSLWAFQSIDVKSAMESLQNQVYSIVQKIEKPLQPLQLVAIDIDLGNGESFPMVFIKTSPNQVKGFYRFCPLDRQTDLSKGFVIYDKLICPKHGCCFSIENGMVETAPAQDDLLIYKVNYDEENNLLRINIPSILPKYMHPISSNSASSDLRKVYIIGDGPAGMSAAEQLRKMGFSGNISIFTDSSEPQLKKNYLTKVVNFQGNENLLLNRYKEFWKSLDINMYQDQEIQSVENDSDVVSFLKLNSGTKLYYDALILASGTPKEKYEKQFPPNLIQLKNLENFKRAERYLKIAENIVIVNVNYESLELASTLRQKYPNKKITLIDFNDKTYIQKDLKNNQYRQLLKNFLNENIDIMTNKSWENSEMLFNNGEITGIKISQDTIDADMIYLFDENQGQSFLKKRTEGMSMQVNQFGQVPVSSNQSSVLFNVFAAGSVAQSKDPNTNFRQNHIRLVDAMEQGKFAALNLYETQIPNDNVAFSYYDYFGQTLMRTGNLTNSQVKCSGDISNLDFICYYHINNHIYGALSSGHINNKKNLLLREALKIGKKMNIEYLSQDEKLFFNKLYNTLMEDESIRCMQSEYMKLAQQQYNSNIFKDQSYYNGEQMKEFENSPLYVRPENKAKDIHLN